MAGLADRLTWQDSSVTVSVIVLGLSRWLVTCFFGCSGARDTLWLCYLRVPGALNADLVAMLGAPGLVTSLGWLILLLFACPRLRLSRSRSSSWV